MHNGHITDGYIGTYYSEQSRGIYHFTFDTESGRMSEPELFYEAPNAKWVSLCGSSMALPIEKDGRAGTCFLKLKDGKPELVAEILEERQTPCYILQDGDYIYTANYHEGNVMVYQLDGGNPDSVKLVKRIENGGHAGCHQILLHEAYLMVPCLEQNRIRLFDTENGFAPVGEILFPEGTGPRHGIFNRNHTRLYVVSEWSNELFVFQVHGMRFVLTQSISILPYGGDGSQKEAAAAAIRLTEDERFLYISVRGADIIAALDVSGDKAAVMQHASCGGVHPRDFVLSGDERFLVAANRFDGGIACIGRDTKTGLLGVVQQRVSMPEGVAIIFSER